MGPEVTPPCAPAPVPDLAAAHHVAVPREHHGRLAEEGEAGHPGPVHPAAARRALLSQAGPFCLVNRTLPCSQRLASYGHGVCLKQQVVLHMQHTGVSLMVSVWAVETVGRTSPFPPPPNSQP